MNSGAKIRPIVYGAIINVRFDDLDPYGNVNSGRYMDYVMSSRWSFAAEKFNMTAADITENGIGFFLTKSEMNFKKSIIGAGAIFVSSHVQSIEGAILNVPFKISSKDGDILYCNGGLRFAVMDLKTGIPAQLPEFAYKYFFESLTGGDLEIDPLLGPTHIAQI